MSICEHESAPQAHINPASSPAATNAVTNLPANYNTLSGLLGLSDGLNTANAAQNDLATKYNYLATLYNDMVGKFNAVLLQLQTAGMQLAQ